MPDVAGPFDGTNWYQAQWYRDAPMRESSGVYGTPQNTVGAGELALTINGLGWSLGLGRAHVRGAGYERTTSPATGASPANTNASLSRIDRLVLRRDLAAKTVTPVLLQGTPASTPSLPSLQQAEDGQWDFPLYRWVVGPASSTVLTDVRDERRWIGTSGIPIGPSISGGLQRTGATNTFKLNPNAFTDLQTIVSAQQGAWRDYNPGNGVGKTCDVAGLYRIDALIRSGFNGNRYEELTCEAAGFSPFIMGNGSGFSGQFGGAGGSLDLECPNGISIVFRHFCGAGPTVEGDLLTSRWAVRWVRPLG